MFRHCLYICRILRHHTSTSNIYAVREACLSLSQLRGLHTTSRELGSVPNRILIRKMRDAILSRVPEPRNASIVVIVEELCHQNRVTSYSATDLSELVHFLSAVVSESNSGIQVEADVMRDIRSLIPILLNELVSRGHCLIIRNELPKSEQFSQTITLIGASNILFAVKQLIVKDALADAKTIGCLVKECIIDALYKHCEKDAVRGSRAFHLVSIMESLLIIPGRPANEWTVCRRLIDELMRKKPFMSEDEILLTKYALTGLAEYFAEHPLAAQFINRLVIDS